MCQPVICSTVERDSPIPPVDKVATEMTGGGTLEAAAEADAKRKAPRLRGGPEVGVDVREGSGGDMGGFNVLFPVLLPSACAL